MQVLPWALPRFKESMKIKLHHILIVVLTLCCIWTADAQNRTVTGVVVDNADSSPVAYATVSVPGTSLGTTTDSKGAFKLSIPKKTENLMISMLGYAPQTVKLGARTDLIVSLVKETLDIDEVVVTGFQTLKKSTFTGSSVKLKADDLQMSGETDISRMLEGKAAGVQIQNVSGTFGAAPKVRVRGVTSISGENKPLWVVDGVVLEDVVNISNDQLASGDPTTLLGSSVAGINTNDIETIDILKDAAATALYGARAMNGVIVITTKRGREGKPVVRYTGNYTIRSVPTYGQFNIMNSADQMSIYAEMERKGLLKPDIVNNAAWGVYGMMYNRMQTVDPQTGNFLLENTPEARKAFLLDHARANTNWFDLLFRHSLMNEHTISISAGSKFAKTYASVGFLNDPGWTVADKVNRYTANLRSDFTLSKKFELSLLAQGSVRSQRAPGSLSQDPDRVTGSISRSFDINPFSYALNTSRALRPYDSSGDKEYYTLNYAPFNIFDELKYNKIDLDVIDVKAQAEFSYKIVEGLKYSFTGAVRYVKSKQTHEIHEKSNMANAYRAAGNSTIRSNNPYLYRDPDDPDAEPVVVLPYGGFYNTAENKLVNYDIRNSLSYSKSWNDKHDLNVLVGQQIKYTDRTIEEHTGYGFLYDMGGTVNVDYRILKQMIESNFPYYGRSLTYDRFAAFYANADYTFDKRYSISGTLRYDGSNNLGTASGSRWLPTWNVSAKWNLGQERFMKELDWLDAFSVRASYGLTASMPPISNATAVFVNTNTTRPGNDIESEIIVSQLANKELTWEKSYQSNFGFDFSIYRGRFDFSFDYFIRKSFDLITVIKTSGIGGEMYKYANVADLKASGFDISIGVRPVVLKDFRWTSNITLGYSHNEITRSEYQQNVFGLVQTTGGNKEGYPVNSLFSIPFAGIDSETGLPMFYGPDGEKNYSANFQSTNTDYLKYEGPVDPKFTGGFNNTFTYKGLSLNAFFTFQAGNVVRLTPSFSSSYDDTQAMPREMFARWALPGDEARTNVPAIADNETQKLLVGIYPYNSYNYSTVRTAKGDFIRLKSLSLSYDLPQRWMNATTFISSATVRFSVKNVCLLYADKKLNGQDPEFVNTGGVAQPIQRQFIISLDLAF